ncbi:MAG: PTS sugar transporter subunit IIA, partial [Anaerotignaceae bacterium]
NILLQQTLLNWLSDEISDLVFLSPTSMPSESEELASQSDIILTTEKGKYYDSGFAFYINPFPNQQDYLNLRLAVDGFKSIDDIISIFHKELFFVHNGDNRENILKILCESATEYFNIEDCYLHKAVTDREQLGSTFFGNGIAAPHPISAVSPDSFVAVSVLPQPVVWDDDKNTVNLVLMVCIGKNNTKAFHLWNYLSSIFANRGFVEQLVSAPSYTTFIRLLKETISDNFQKK